MRRGLSPQGWYESPIAGRVHYQSGYEKKFMLYLDQKGYKWQKCKERFPYIAEDGSKHYYNPDFYMPEWNLYVEVKGMIRMNDPMKFEAFPKDKQLVLLEYDELTKLGLSLFNPKTRERELKPGEWPYNMLKQMKDFSKTGILSESMKCRLKEKVGLFQPL